MFKTCMRINPGGGQNFTQKRKRRNSIKIFKDSEAKKKKQNCVQDCGITLQKSLVPKRNNNNNNKGLTSKCQENDTSVKRF